MTTSASHTASRLFAILAWLCLGFPTHAGIVNLTSQSRSVSATFTDGTPNQLQQAPDFSPFNAQVGFPKVNAIADQNSTLTLTPDGASFHALSNVRGSSATATFASSFHVAFDVTRPVDYTLLYGFGASGAGNDVTPTALFITPSGTRDIHLGVDETGVLQPGAYQSQVDDVGGKNVTYTLSFEAVPLPPALWATLATLPVVAVAVVWLRRASKC